MHSHRFASFLAVLKQLRKYSFLHKFRPRLQVILSFHLHQLQPLHPHLHQCVIQVTSLEAIVILYVCAAGFDFYDETALSEIFSMQPNPRNFLNLKTMITGTTTGKWILIKSEVFLNWKISTSQIGLILLMTRQKSHF